MPGKIDAGERWAKMIRQHMGLPAYLTDGVYGRHLGGAIGLGYVPWPGECVAELLVSRIEIEVAGTRLAAKASLQLLHDPKLERLRS